MLVDNENEAKSSTSNMIIGAVIIVTAILIFAMVSGGSGKRNDDDCIEWGVVVDDHGVKKWAPIPYTPKTREDAEYIARNLETQDRGGRYYTARCKEYKK